jgi:mono/diheme cytochrome c family protein
MLMLFTIILVTGCDPDGYPADLTYPSRTDALVVGRPDRDAQGFDRPGQYPGVLFPDLPDDYRETLLRNPSQMDTDQHHELDRLLGELFGTPANPRVSGIGNAVEPVKALVDFLHLDNKTLELGSSIYRHQCLHCHGLSGDGHGPTSPWVNPHPRDYRPGSFKFTSSKQDEGEREPRKYDLIRTIREGIEGASMPSFRLIPDDQIDALASYVIHLSLRGQTEFYVIRTAIDGGLDTSLPVPERIKSAVEDALANFAGRWQTAEKSLIQPDTIPASMSDKEMAESVARGWDLFRKPGPASCISCHMDYGRQSAYKYDEWGTVVRPIDVTQGIYRGGRRPIDLFWRIHSGIKGTGMTAFGGSVTSAQIWDLVNFLRVLPYPAMRKQYGIRLESS